MGLVVAGFKLDPRKWLVLYGVAALGPPLLIGLGFWAFGGSWVVALALVTVGLSACVLRCTEKKEKKRRLDDHDCDFFGAFERAVCRRCRTCLGLAILGTSPVLLILYDPGFPTFVFSATCVSGKG